jgi:hypothetical protein
MVADHRLMATVAPPTRVASTGRTLTPSGPMPIPAPRRASEQAERPVARINKSESRVMRRALTEGRSLDGVL